MCVISNTIIRISKFPLRNDALSLHCLSDHDSTPVVEFLVDYSVNCADRILANQAISLMSILHR